MTEVYNEETSALSVALDSPQEDYSEFFDDFANLALNGQEDRLNPSTVSEVLHLYLYLLEKIRET